MIDGVPLGSPGLTDGVSDGGFQLVSGGGIAATGTAKLTIKSTIAAIYILQLHKFHLRNMFNNHI